MPIIRRNNCIYATLGTCYSVWMTVWYAGSSIQNNKYQVSHKYSCFPWWWAHSHLKHVEKRNKHTKKKLSTKLALFTWLYRDAWSTKRKIHFFHLTSISCHFFFRLVIMLTRPTQLNAHVTGRKWHGIDVVEIMTLYLVITVVTVLVPFYCHIGNRQETQELLHTVNFMAR